MDAVATFTSYELMNYKDFIEYAVILSMEALSRPELRDKVSVTPVTSNLNVTQHIIVICVMSRR